MSLKETGEQRIRTTLIGRMATSNSYASTQPKTLIHNTVHLIHSLMTLNAYNLTYILP